MFRERKRAQDGYLGTVFSCLMPYLEVRMDNFVLKMVKKRDGEILELIIRNELENRNDINDCRCSMQGLRTMHGGDGQ